MLLNILIFNFLFVFVPNKVRASGASECGIIKFTKPLILGGTQTSKGEWPFITALYYTADAKFFCGGTIISDKHILTGVMC